MNFLNGRAICTKLTGGGDKSPLTARATFFKKCLTDSTFYDIFFSESEVQKMTKREIERSLYVNESKKKRKEKASQGRKDWTGLRPTVYKDKSKYDRNREKRKWED